MPPRDLDMIKNMKQNGRGYKITELTPQQYEFMLQERDKSTYEQANKEGFITICGHTPDLGAITKDDEKGKRGPIAIAHMDPNCFSRWFREWCSDYGFGQFREITHYIERDGKMYARGTKYSGLTPHMLRHTQATLLIGENVDIKTVSSRLGHSTVKLTLDTYAHAIAPRTRQPPTRSATCFQIKSALRFRCASPRVRPLPTVPGVLRSRAFL